MSTSLAAVFSGEPGHIELWEIPSPAPKPGEMLVSILGCTLCGSDLHTLTGRRQTPVPTILGHEIVGQIAAIGESTPRHDIAGNLLQPGDRVSWAIVASCGRCFFCERGLPQKCLRSIKYGHQAFEPGRELLGGLAEHCLLVPGTAVVRLPDDLPLAIACFANCATATAAAAIEAAGDLKGACVGILGAGLLGLTIAAMAKAGGAEEVICVDIHSTRREKAHSFGASRALPPGELPQAVAEATDSRGLDVAFEVSGAPSAFSAAWPLVRTGGTFIVVGSVFPSPPVELPLEQLVRRHLVLRGIHNYAPHHLLTAVDFLHRHQAEFPFQALVAKWHSLAQIEQAIDDAQDLNHLRIGVRNEALKPGPT